MAASDRDNAKIGYRPAPEFKDLLIGLGCLDEEDILPVEWFGDKSAGSLDDRELDPSLRRQMRSPTGKLPGEIAPLFKQRLPRFSP